MAKNQKYEEYRVNALPPENSSLKPGDNYLLNLGANKFRRFVVSDSLNLVGEAGAEFIEKDTMDEFRVITAREILAIQQGCYKGVKLNGYHTKGDTPAPIEYYVSLTSESDDGGSIIDVGGMKLEHNFNNNIDLRYYGVNKTHGLFYSKTTLPTPVDGFVFVEDGNGNKFVLKSFSIDKSIPYEVFDSLDNIEDLGAIGGNIIINGIIPISRDYTTNNNIIGNGVFETTNNSKVVGVGGARVLLPINSIDRVKDIVAEEIEKITVNTENIINFSNFGRRFLNGYYPNDVTASDYSFSNFEGKEALRITKNGVNAGFYGNTNNVLTNNFSLLRGKKITVSFDIYPVVPITNFRIRLVGGSPISHNPSTEVGKWQRISYTQTVPASAEELYFAIFTGDSVNDFYIANLKVVIGESLVDTDYSINYKDLVLSTFSKNSISWLDNLLTSPTVDTSPIVIPITTGGMQSVIDAGYVAITTDGEDLYLVTSTGRKKIAFVP